jgi:asparagine synthase (glutamine-hydrolysing)
MCGIAAVLDPSGATDDSAAAAMISALRHRGPDGDGSHRIGPALLLHTRLAIIDVDGGHQPLISEDGSVAAVVNGEIYNHEQLREELIGHGHSFATRSDSEVIVHGYEQWGPDVVRRLNGIFAFVLWDDRRRRLVAARDHFGVKPLYWRSDGRRLALSSEVGALLAGGFASARVDRVALDHVLAWSFVPAPRTIFEGISKLPAASLLVAEDGAVELSSYREAPGGPLSDASPVELATSLCAEFERAVERQMMSDVPYGAFLSGGIDSTAIVAAMARAQAEPPRTFTIGFPGHGDVLDERAAAAASAAALGTRHRATAMLEDDYPSEVARCVERLEEPCGTASAPAALQLSRFAAQDVKVVLSGQGADEPFGGYPRHQAAAVVRLTERLPGFVAGPAGRIAHALPRNERIKRAAALLDSPPGLDRLLRIFEIVPRGVRAELLGGDGREAAAERAERATNLLRDVERRDDPLEKALYLDTRLFLPDSLLTYGDKMSMAAGLEQRVPFLDLEFMRLAERVPARMRVRGIKRKWLYRQAMAGLVPQNVMERKKHPFATPYDSWLRTSLGAHVERAYRTQPGLGELIDADVVGRLVAEHQAGRMDHKRALYCLLELASWHERFVEPDVPAGAGILPSAH